MLIVKELDNSKLVEDACALLYRVLVEQDNWNFSPDNPSQLRVEIKNNRRLLVDRFTDNAVWFGAFDDSNLVGCIRVTFIDENNKLEVEGYNNSHVIQEYLPLDKSQCVELTRVTVLYNYNNIGVLKPLFLTAFKYCDENKYSIFCASSNRYLIKLFKDIGFPLKMEMAFKYEAKDPNLVNFYFSDYNKSEVNNMIQELESYQKNKEASNNNSKIFEALEIIAPILPTMVYWHNTEGVVLGLNALCLRSIGVTKKEQVLGKTPYEFYQKDIAKHILEHNNRVMRTGEVLSQDEQIEDIETGKVKIFRSTKAPLYNDEGKIIGIIGSSIEITNERQAEVLKTEFIQNMQHDIRTPISGIFSLLEATNQDGNFEEFKKALPYAAKASKEILDFCNEVIDFENVEYGAKPVYTRKFSLLELLHGAINLNSAAALAHKSTLELKISDDVPDVIKGDDYRLKKILINLIGNAVKFTEHGQIILCVTATNKNNKQATIRFKVSDTGIGISDDKIHTIFEKFTRINPSNSGKFKGSGLGLHIVKKFVEEIDAELDVKSTLGKGTVFSVDVTFDLPKVSKLADEDVHHELNRHLLVDVTLPENDKIELVASNHKETLKKLSPTMDISKAIRICLIEDDALAMMAAENKLSGLARHCHITKATNVVEALHTLKEQPFDVIICDLGLPDGTGFDIAAAVKIDTTNANHQTPFIALTAHSDDAKRERAKAVGFLAVYNKPLSKEQADKILTDYVPDKNKIDQHTVVDLAMSTEAYNGNVKSVIDMITVLISSFAKERPLFEDAFNTNDFTKARELFHKFRGGLSYIRIPEVDKLAMILHEDVKEFEKRNEPLETLNNKLQALFKAMDAVKAWLVNYQKQNT